MAPVKREHKYINEKLKKDGTRRKKKDITKEKIK